MPKKARKSINDALGIQTLESIKIQFKATYDGFPQGRTTDEKIILTLEDRHQNQEHFLNVLVFHEYTHYVLRRATNASRHTPWWFHEGLAHLMSEKLTTRKLRTFLTICEDHLPTSTIQDLANAPKPDSSLKDRERAALQSYAVVAWLEKTHGINFIREFIACLAKGETAECALEGLGIAYNTLDSGWQTWVKKHFEARYRSTTLAVRQR